ncbi:MAG TPA: YciI family protein, partial [Candidatus Bathyarchaeia archaeon]|nr:YciI family protein [Candidatus Bathyarchaeia archaeon]
MIVAHVAITAADDYLERRAAHRQAHLARIVELRRQGFVIGGGPSPDGRRAELVYRAPRPSDLSRLVEEDPYWTGGVWTA